MRSITPERVHAVLRYAWNSSGRPIVAVLESTYKGRAVYMFIRLVRQHSQSLTARVYTMFIETLDEHSIPISRLTLCYIILMSEHCTCMYVSLCVLFSVTEASGTKILNLGQLQPLTEFQKCLQQCSVNSQCKPSWYKFINPLPTVAV